MKKSLIVLALLLSLSICTFAESGMDIAIPEGKVAIVFIKPPWVTPLSPTYLFIDHSRFVPIERGNYCIMDVEPDMPGVVYSCATGRDLFAPGELNYQNPTGFKMFRLQKNEIMFISVGTRGYIEEISSEQYQEYLAGNSYTEIAYQE